MPQLPDVSTYWGCPQVNKFEQVYSDGHQMSPSGPISEVQGRAGGTCTVRSNASWVMITWGTLPFHLNRQTDRGENITFLQLNNSMTLTLKVGMFSDDVTVYYLVYYWFHF